jgi:hypothetical protein
MDDGGDGGTDDWLKEGITLPPLIDLDETGCLEGSKDTLGLDHWKAVSYNINVGKRGRKRRAGEAVMATLTEGFQLTPVFLEGHPPVEGP